MVRRDRRNPHSPRWLGRRRSILLTGEISYSAFDYTGYGDGQGTNLEDFISEEMRRDWADNRTELLKFWRSGEYTTDILWLFICGSADTLPWAEQVFGSSARIGEEIAKVPKATHKGGPKKQITAPGKKLGRKDAMPSGMSGGRKLFSW